MDQIWKSHIQTVLTSLTLQNLQIHVFRYISYISRPLASPIIQCPTSYQLSQSNRTMFKSLRVHRGAEAPANTDHRLVIAKTCSLHPMRVIKPQARKRLDVEALTRDDDLANKYNVAVTNAFGVLGSLPEDVEACWETIRTTILGAAQDTLSVVTKPNRPWLSTDTLSIIQKKREARPGIAATVRATPWVQPTSACRLHRY